MIRENASNHTHKKPAKRQVCRLLAFKIAGRLYFNQVHLWGCRNVVDADALLYSLIETAKTNGLEPWAYLNLLFEHLPGAKTPEVITALLPFNLKMDDIKRKGLIL